MPDAPDAPSLRERFFDAGLSIDTIVNLDAQVAWCDSHLMDPDLAEMLDEDDATSHLAELLGVAESDLRAMVKEIGWAETLSWPGYPDPLGWLLEVSVPTYLPHPDGEGAQIRAGWRHAKIVGDRDWERVLEKAIQFADEMRVRDWPGSVRHG